MREATAQGNNRFRQRGLRLMRTMQWSVRTIHKPLRRAALSPLAPCIERVPAHTVTSAQVRNTPVARVVFRKHPNPLFHPTGLLEWHRKSSFRPTLTRRPSTQSKLSGIYPDCTRRAPAPPTPPRQQGAEGALTHRALILFNVASLKPSGGVYFS